MLISPMKERDGFDWSLLVLLACLQLHAVFLYVSQWEHSHGSARYKSLHRYIHWLPAGAAALSIYTKALNHPQHLGWVVYVCETKVIFMSFYFHGKQSPHDSPKLCSFIEIEGFMGSIGAQEAPGDVDGQLPVKLTTYFYSSWWLSTLKHSAQSSCVMFSGFSLGQNPIRRKRAAIQISLLSSYFTSVPLGSDLVNN